VIKVSVFYPNRPGAKFDMAYYLSSHMPMVKRTIGSAVKSMAVDEGVGLVDQADPAAAPKYLAIGHLLFDSVDAFQQAFAAHGAPIIADVPNYTNIQPVIQINEVRM
jgi:uncharacterized protein (TIGR02118 family)